MWDFGWDGWGSWNTQQLLCVYYEADQSIEVCSLLEKKYTELFVTGGQGGIIIQIRVNVFILAFLIQIKTSALWQQVLGELWETGFMSSSQNIALKEGMRNPCWVLFFLLIFIHFLPWDNQNRTRSLLIIVVYVDRKITRVLFQKPLTELGRILKTIEDFTNIFFYSSFLF